MLKKQPVCFNSGHVASLVFGWIYLYLGSSQSYCHCKCQKRTQWHDAATTMFHCNAMTRTCASCCYYTTSHGTWCSTQRVKFSSSEHPMCSQSLKFCLAHSHPAGMCFYSVAYIRLYCKTDEALLRCFSFQ